VEERAQVTAIDAQPSLSSSAPTRLAYSPGLDATVKLLLVITVTLVTCMEFLTSYAVAVALPDIQGDLSASFDEASWVLTKYSTCFLVGLMLSNWLADRIGFRSCDIEFS
jgi:hypothetical protein